MSALGSITCEAAVLQVRPRFAQRFCVFQDLVDLMCNSGCGPLVAARLLYFCIVLLRSTGVLLPSSVPLIGPGKSVMNISRKVFGQLASILYPM